MVDMLCCLPPCCFKKKVSSHRAGQNLAPKMPVILFYMIWFVEPSILDEKTDYV